jgi:hypothetical protein
MKNVKVHGEGQYPFTYRGENEVLLGRFEQIFSGQRYLSCGRHPEWAKVKGFLKIFSIS